METLILIIAFVIEAAFAAYSIITKSNQERVRSFVRIGAFAAFVIFTLASVIQWSFRWYGLAALLLVWAVLGAWALIRKKGEKREYKAGSSVFSAIATLLLVCVVITPALIFPQYRLPRMTGKHQVDTVKYTYTDASRVETFTNTGGNRKVNVEFWYPRDTGERYPLVVFSHGAFGMKNSNTSTFMELASNGYVVCSIDHPYHSLFTSGSDGHMITVDQSFMQEILGVNNGKYNEEEIFKLTYKWMNVRTADVNFVLNTIIQHAKNGSSEVVYQRIDPGKIGLMGHSLGAVASAQVARERNDIDAVINLDADLYGEYLNYVDGKYVLNDKTYPVPILTFYSDDLAQRIAAIPNANEIIAVKHISATAPNAYEVHLAGTNHMSFTDLPLVSPFLVSVINSSVHIGGGHAADKYYIIEKMNDIVLQFFDVYLKGEGAFTYKGTY